MCRHISKVQELQTHFVGGAALVPRTLSITAGHDLVTFNLSCDPAERERQLRILNAAVLQIQDYVPGLYDQMTAPPNTNDSDAGKYGILPGEQETIQRHSVEDDRGVWDRHEVHLSITDEERTVLDIAKVFDVPMSVLDYRYVEDAATEQERLDRYSDNVTVTKQGEVE